MNPTIILIGPIGTGKTTIGRLLAQKLNQSLCSVDEVRQNYYQQIGYDQTLASNIAASDQGLRGLLSYTEPYDARMIEMLLADYQGSIIDFGGSNSIFSDEAILAQVKKTLAPYPNVILLLPSPDPTESNQILKDRLIKMLTEAGKTYSDELFELNNYFIQHASNHLLAQQTVYTKGKSAETIANEIVAGLTASTEPQNDPSE